MIIGSNRPDTMMKPVTPIYQLPEELQLQIFQYLDSKAPSEIYARKEPSLQLTTSDVRTYKNISLVSKRWRRIVLPLLFKASRLRLDAERRPEWSQCRVCGQSGAKQRQDKTRMPALSDVSYHEMLFDEAKAANHVLSAGETLAVRDSASISSAEWASRFFHGMDDYLTFVQTHDLAARVESFTLLTSRMIQSRHVRFPHSIAGTRDYRYRASAAMWQHLLSTISLSRVVIVAPPVDMACLTNCAIDLFGDWAFADMDFHILELRMDPVLARQIRVHPVDYPSLQYIPDGFPGIAGSSVLKLQPWTHLALNEGSFLRAYGTYEYFERGPPSLIHSIKDSLTQPSLIFTTHDDGGNHSAAAANSSSSSYPVSSPPLPALRSLTYTAILPFATHLDIRGFLPYLDELDVQLAPEPDSGILDDKARVGKAELEDCWQEFLTAYRLITRPFRTARIRPDGRPRLRRFVCRDVRIRALREELDEEFTPLCLPVWAEMEPGVFVRLAERLPEGQEDLFQGFD